MTPDELVLVARAVRGDREATGALLAGTRARAVSWALKILRNAADAEEVVQEATLRALERLEGLEDPRTFRTWLYRMVFRLSLNSLRDRATALRAERARGAVMEPSELPPEGVEALRGAMARLPWDLRVVLLMHYWEGLGYAEIATRLGVPEGTVKARAFRAHERLRRLMAF